MESVSKLVNAVRQKDERTFNNAVTNSTSLNSIVDLFFIAGASRTMPEDEIVKMLAKSWVEDSLLTLKTIFWAGDIRGGAGERRFFRIALKWLNNNFKDSLNKNISLVSYYNRWDSLFGLDNEKVFDLVKNGLMIEKNRLLSKWMPRKKQYNNFASKFRKKYNLGFKEYRKLIVSLSKTVEQDMCSKKWDSIEYKHVPSVAFNKYRKAFLRNDENRFTMFIEKVKKGEEKIHADAIFPYDIYNSVRNGGDNASIEEQWKSLPNYMQESNERILPVCDVSGSMEGLPLSISVSLGIYLSERNIGIFKDAFITFSSRPTIQFLKGGLVSRMQQLEIADWTMNTDLSAVFRLILNKAISSKISQNEMPTMILIISDMEFDQCGELTGYEDIVNQYTYSGYKIPKVVFWNVNGRSRNVPVSSKIKNVALVSGASPSIMKSILSGKDFTPKGIMLETLTNERYSNIIL